ncbi:MAG: PPE family protein [Mycobacterium sp.]
MVLDFAALPPEVNSGLMYAGAGAGPLMAAAGAWNNLAAELATTATSWESIVSTLTTEQWTGVGSTAAAAAAQPYVEWLSRTAAAAEQAAAQASASAAAYEAAFTATVPPPVVAANRSLVTALMATNFLGINTPAIMAAEAQYAEMWVQDAVAMYGYSAASVAAAALQPLTPASPTTNPAAAGLQPAAATSAASTPIQDAVVSFLQSPETFGTQIFAALSPNVQTLLTTYDGFIGTLFNFNAIQQVGVTAAWWVGITIPTAVSYIHTAAAAYGAPAAAAAGAAADAAAAAEGALAGSVTPVGLGGALTAGLGEASAVGGLSVPASWSSAAPVTLASSAAPLEGSGWTVPEESGVVVPGMPGMMGAAKASGAFAAPRYGFKPTVMPKQVLV